MREVRWERMFPDELEKAFTDCPLLYLSYGMCEPHGPQNAVGLDGLKAHAIACRAAHAHGGIVAPPDFWHIHELGGYAFFGLRAVGEVKRHWMTAVPPWIHFKNICYQIRTAEVQGFHAVILLTGHYGPNWEDLKDLVELLQPQVGARLYSLPDFEANQPGFDHDGQSGGDHAGKIETSLLWALEPECVDASRLPPPAEAAKRPFAMGESAYASHRQTGERMVADEVRWLGAKAKELLEEYERLRPEHRLRTYQEVEDLWARVVRPQLKKFRTMQLAWAEGDAIPEDSMWHENWRVPEPP